MADLMSLNPSLNSSNGAIYLGGWRSGLLVPICAPCSAQ